MVNHHSEILDEALGHITGPIEWVSPLASDQYAEYRDQAALEVLGVSSLAVPLNQLWPACGPQWDALGKTEQSGVVLVEAKAHVGELLSGPSRALNPESAARIGAALEAAVAWFGANPRVPWNGPLYQYANRLAHLYFLQQVCGIPAVLAFVYFAGDRDMMGPDSQEEWRGAIALAQRLLGLSSLPPSVVDVFIDIGRIAGERTTLVDGSTFTDDVRRPVQTMVRGESRGEVEEMDRIPFRLAGSSPAPAGVYVMYSQSPIGDLAWDPTAGAAYVGKAQDGLRRRLLREHSGDTGRSTLRRTLGALLKDELALRAWPRASRGEPKPINFTNYDFDPDGNARLSDWMSANLEVEYLVTAEYVAQETALIGQHRPPLNLTGWANRILRPGQGRKGTLRCRGPPNPSPSTLICLWLATTRTWQPNSTSCHVSTGSVSPPT